jgi:murein DD-endopeptidase MepM/ murein hydrolase activator NlpD
MLLWPACVAMLAALPARVRARALGGVPSAAPRASAAAPCVGVDVDGWCLPTPRCAMNALDLDGLCVDRAGATAEGALTLATNAHTERSGRHVLYEHLPRRPDLPADYDRYVYPLDAPARGSIVASGYDLDRPDAQQRRGTSLSAVGHGGVDILRERGAPVRAVSLRGEVGAAEVLFVGPLFGNTVALRHVVRDGDVTRTYLALHGHLDHPAPGVAKGVTVEPGTVLGFVGDSGAEGVVHLHYEVRLVRAGVDPARVEPAALTNQSVSVPCDPRNVLPFR